MKDLLIIAVTAAMFVFCWFLTRKFCSLMEQNRHPHDSLLSSDDNTLRIGLCDPLTANSLLHVLEEYATANPNVAISLFSGTEEELTEGLSSQKLDVAFFPKNAVLPERSRFRIREISLKDGSVRIQYGGLMIQPMSESPVEQQLLWQESRNASAANGFIHCFLNDMKGNMEIGSGM